MKSLKKTVIAVLVIGIVSVAGMAMAQPMQGKGQHGPMGPFAGHHSMMGQPWNRDNLPPAPQAGPEFFCPCGRFSPDMPQEVRAKAVEAAKLRIDLEDVLSQNPLNREKALELNGKISGLEQEIRAWRFEQKLNRIEEFNKKLAEDAGKPEEK